MMITPGPADLKRQPPTQFDHRTTAMPSIKFSLGALTNAELPRTVIWLAVALVLLAVIGYLLTRPRSLSAPVETSATVLPVIDSTEAAPSVVPSQAAGVSTSSGFVLTTAPGTTH